MAGLGFSNLVYNVVRIIHQSPAIKINSLATVHDNTQPYSSRSIADHPAEEKTSLRQLSCSVRWSWDGHSLCTCITGPRRVMDIEVYRCKSETLAKRRCDLGGPGEPVN